MRNTLLLNAVPEPIIIWSKAFSLTTLLVLFAMCSISAQNVSQTEAEEIANTFFAAVKGEQGQIIQSMAEKGDSKNINQALKSDSNNANDDDALFYMFNYDNGGFVIIAGDERYDPVIGYSTESSLDMNKENKNLWEYMEGHKIQMQLIKNGQLDPVAEKLEQNTKAWADLKSGKTENTQLKSAVVEPLTTTLWGQEQYYNTDCPADPAGTHIDGGTYVGCVPVALAQILKYHDYPARGNGYKYYEDGAYGFLYADYANTYYNWNNMPDSLNDYNSDVAQLMFHAGASIYTAYSTSYTASFTTNVPYALIYHFNYSNDAKFIVRGGDTAGIGWFNTVRSELDLNRPVLMTGYFGEASSHAWVVDGYDNDGYYHMNWGWEGIANGWFIDNGEYWERNPNNDNDYDITFYDNQFMVYKIYPSDQQCEAVSVGHITISAVTDNTIYFGTYQYQGQVMLEFRYRRYNTNDDWITIPASVESYHLAEGLEPGLTYEIQVRQQCSDGSWSEFSGSRTSTTSGVSCTAVDDSALSISSLSDHFVYVYYNQPYAGNNQFRYREAGTNDDWIETSIADTYYRALENLASGTTYEFQVRHECTTGEWTDYSESSTFTTTGEPDNGGGGGPIIELDCETPPSSNMASDSYYVYYFDVTTGWQQSQFRWRISGTANWTETPAAARYYRRIVGMGIEFGDNVELQVRVQCANGEWSDYTTSYFFTSQDD